MKNGKKVDFLIISHYHQDNQGGINYCLKQNTKCFSLERTKDIALKKGLPAAGHYFKNNMTINLGSIEVQAIFEGAGHTKDNLVIWFPHEKILFGGCLIKDIYTKRLGNISEANLKEWPKTIKKLQKKYPSNLIIIPGHGKQDNNKLFDHTLKLFTSTSVKLSNNPTFKPVALK